MGFIGTEEESGLKTYADSRTAGDEILPK